MQFCIFEDTHFRNFLPLVYFRPVYDRRCGVLSLRQKIESRLPSGLVALHVRHELAAFLGQELQSRSINAIPPKNTWFINGRVIADDAFG